MGDHKLGSDHGMSVWQQSVRHEFDHHVNFDVLISIGTSTRWSAGHHNIITERLPFC
jgi:hypothetical protein